MWKPCRDGATHTTKASSVDDQESTWESSGPASGVQGDTMAAGTVKNGCEVTESAWSEKLDAASTDTCTFEADGAERMCSTKLVYLNTKATASMMPDDDEHAPNVPWPGVLGHSSKGALAVDSINVACEAACGGLTTVFDAVSKVPETPVCTVKGNSITGADEKQIEESQDNERCTTCEAGVGSLNKETVVVSRSLEGMACNHSSSTSSKSDSCDCMQSVTRVAQIGAVGWLPGGLSRRGP